VNISAWIGRNWQVLGVAYIIFSSIVDGMPVPKPTDSNLYVIAYRASHTLAGNLVTAFSKIGRTPWPGETPGSASFPPSSESKK
jgi:hypothetical protein